MKTRLPIAVVFLFLLHPVATQAQWQFDGITLSTAANDQEAATIVSDGTGGAIITWHDSRSGNSDIYAQRVNGFGVVQWAADGVALCIAANDQSIPLIIPDGAGGAIVAWSDRRSGAFDIYAQRVNISGVVQWAANGVTLCSAANEQVLSSIVSDGAGGAIVAWSDLRSGTFDIYVQRINAAGVVQWTANGVAVCTATNLQLDAGLVSDGAGGAILTWQDARSGIDYDIYAQRVNASGTPKWLADGVALCYFWGDQVSPTIASDGAGGAIVTWADSRDINDSIYAQRVNDSGVAWTANGVVISPSALIISSPQIVSDGAGGAIVTWFDSDIRAQRVTAFGSILWTVYGSVLCSAVNTQLYPTIVPDGVGGAIVTWEDERAGASDVYAQRVNAAGATQWATNGVALCTAESDQWSYEIIPDGSRGVIVVWTDSRNGSSDIYAQRAEATYGYWGHPEPVLVSAADIPNDQGGKVAVNWTASGRDLPVPRAISHYTVWRAIDALPLNASSSAAFALADLNSVREEVSTPVFVAMSGYYWELVGTQSAHGWPGYSFSGSTRADSTVADGALEYFMVAAHDQNDDYVAFSSNAVSGYSVDNLAPAAPFLLTAQRAGADVNLKWNRATAPDLRDYSIYRATTSGVTPVPLNFLANSEDTVAVDAGAPTGVLYYIVTAYDVHANQSLPSNEASVGATTNVGNTPTITQLTVLQNHPNPFAGTTELQIGLPRPSDVAIEIYDVAGRRVSSQLLSQQGAGWRKVTFEGRNDAGLPLASGVYFYKVTANGNTVTNKMVIAR